MPSPSSNFLFKRAKVRTNNRIVLAAMTNKQSHTDGRISKNEINWLVRRAKGSFGIVTTAAAHISKDGQGWEGEFGLFHDKFIDRLSLLTQSIKYYDSLILAQ